MAGDWIKMRGNLWDDPRVARLVDLTNSSEAAVVGALYWLWATADQHTEDGVMPGLSLRQIDRKTGLSGFGDALCQIDWLADHPDGVRIVDFERHNGSSAKKRCETAKRVAKHKALHGAEGLGQGLGEGLGEGLGDDADEGLNQPEKHAFQEPVTQDAEKTNAPSVTSALPRERERVREEIHTSPAKLPTALPPCQTQAVVDVFHEKLPELPRVKLLNAGRKRAIGTLWRWVLTSKKSDGTPRATGPNEALIWLGEYFGRARDNDFLMGRIARAGPHAGWRCDFDFLLTEKGMKHVIEKTGDTA